MSEQCKHILGWSDLLAPKKPATMDEAIEHALSVAERNLDDQCGRDHLQLAFWLRELRRRRAEEKRANDLLCESKFASTFMGVRLDEAVSRVRGAPVLKLALESIQHRAEAALGTCSQNDKTALPNALKEIITAAKNALADTPRFCGVDLAKKEETK